MNKPWENDSCEHVKSYYTSYTVPEAAMLWCGISAEELDEHLKHAIPTGDSNEYGRHVLRHPYIPCLEPRCRAIQDAINNSKLKVGRDGGESFYAEGQQVAYSRRTLKRNDLKEWIAKEFPNDKPAFLFDDIERNSHTSISADAYRALLADRDALQKRIEKATEVYKSLREEKELIAKERDDLKMEVEKLKIILKDSAPPNERAETTYQNIIVALLDCIAGNLPEIVKHPSFSSEAKLIDAIDEHYRGYGGLSKSNLSRKFPEAKQKFKSQ